MFGNLATNTQIRELIRDGVIDITPLIEENIRSAHYTLTAGRVLKHDENFELAQVHTFEDGKKDSVYTLEPNGYVVIEPVQRVRLLNSGIVGRFITPSTLIESGLALVSGQISNLYGKDGEGVRFGIKNFLDRNFYIQKTFRVAHIEFYDIRGVAHEIIKMTPEEKRAWANRILRGNDDGITGYD
jgi:hypothetical protein